MVFKIVVPTSRLRFAGHVTRVGEGNCVYMGFTGKFWGKSLLKDLGLDGKVIKVNFKEIVWEGVDSVDLAQDRGR
jgi:hypothetical protein